MSLSRPFRILRVNWRDHGAACALVREKVFVYEMRLSPRVESDGLDPQCFHVLAVSEQGDAFGTGRLEPDGHICRIAVLMPWRQQGVGSAVLDELISIARDQGHLQVTVAIPIATQAFYENNGFEAAGSVYMDGGIPTCRMSLRLGVAQTQINLAC